MEITEKLRTRAMEEWDSVLDTLFNDKEVGHYFTDLVETNVCFIRNRIYELYPNTDMTIENGATKMCIVDRKRSTVIRIPYAYWGDGYEDENGTMYDYFTEDACAKEADIYELAYENFSDQYFAPVIKIEERDNVPIYATPYCFINEEVVTDDIVAWAEKNGELTQEDIDEYSGNYSFYASGSSDSIMDYLQKTVWEDIYDFCSDYDIDDIHAENVGWASEAWPELGDHLLIVDYAGYNAFMNSIVKEF